MKKTIFSAIILAAASFACNAQAQQKVMLNKGDQTVETVKLGADDYIAFGRPEGVPVQKDVEVVSTEAGKNYVSYKVETKEADKLYSHVLLKKSYVELLSIQMNNYFDENDKAALDNIFRTLIFAGYGEVSMGTQSFTIKDGEKDSSGGINFIPGGQEYYLVTAGITMNGDEPSLDNDINYVKVRTKDPGVSSETLTVEYKGVNDNGNAWFDVQSGEGIGSLYFVFGTSASIDEFINTYSYDYLMFTQSNQFTREQWNTLTDDEHVWNVGKEADYNFYALGIDGNGDWVKAEIKNLHLKPSVSNDCPVVDITNKMCVDGELAIQYSIKSKAKEIKSAKMLLMKSDEWDDALNELMKIKEGDDYKYNQPSDAWADYMATADQAVDVTDAVKALGNTLNYKKTFADDERGWYVAVLAVTDEFGTTVTRATFHSHLGEEENWDILSRTFPVKASAKVSAAKGMAPMNGRVAGVAKRK